jgi:hypothetical protein
MCAGGLAAWHPNMAVLCCHRLQDRKRQLDGAPRATQQPDQQQQPAGAAARWSNPGGPTSAAKRLEASSSHGGQHGSTGAAAAAAAWGQSARGPAGVADDPIEVDDDEQDADGEGDAGDYGAATGGAAP